MNRFAGLTYARALAVLADEFAAREALSFHGRSWTFAEVKAEVDRASARLATLGLKADEKIAIWLPNRPEFLWYWLGASQMGLVAVMLNTRLRQEEFIYQIDQSDSVAIIVPGDGAFRDFLGDLCGACPEIADGSPGNLHCATLPKLRHVIACDHYDRHLRGVTDWSKSAPSSALQPSMATDPSLPAMIAYSSGTTALPKGAMLNHSVFRKAYDHGERFGQTADDRLYLCVPLFGILSNINGVLTFWARGSSVMLEERFDAETVLEAIQSKRCTAIYLLPVMIDRLLEHPRFGAYDISSLRTGIIVSIDPDVLRTAATRLNMREVFTSYGMTETSSACTRTYGGDPLELRLTTHGRPFPDIDVRIADPENDAVVPVGQEGEIQVRGYNVMLGYYNKPVETRRAFVDDWYKTGDLGRFNADGTLTFMRRVKDGYKHNGFNVATAEIEAAIRKYPGLRDVSVTDLPHRLYGAVGAAFVIAADGAAPTEDEILRFLKPRLASFKLPAHVFLVDEFPVTAGTGKVQKFRLRELALQRLAADPGNGKAPER